MYRLYIALTLCMFGALAFRIDYDLKEIKDWQYDSNGDENCIKDIIIVLDTSRSVGQTAFEDHVRPFLKNLVTDLQLNVQQDGTRVGFVIFSNVVRTKKMLDIGEKADADELGQYFLRLKWDDVQGGLTRTDLGLKIANEMFEDYTDEDPENHRVRYADVAIVITDGAPRGRTDRKDKEESIKWADALKAQDVFIIGVAVGPDTTDPSKKDELIRFIKNLATSPEDVFVQEDLDDIDKIRGKLIADTCNVPPGKCTCDSQDTMPIILDEGQSTKVLDLPDPTFKCEGGEQEDPGKDIQPPLPADNRFGVGNHTHIYIYTLNGGVTLQCPLTVDVRKHPCEGNKCNPKGGKCVDGTCVCKHGYGGPNCYVLKCRGVDFHSTKQVCCCGTVHPHKPGYKCCGPDYHDPNEQNCCDNANLIPSEGTCPNLD